MTFHHTRRAPSSRRRFLQAGAAACACCGIVGAGLLNELSPLPAPYAEDTARKRGAARPSVDAPILLIVHSARPSLFGRYLGEILRAEGLPAYRVAPLDTLDRATLDRAPIAILCGGELTADQAALLERYVIEGGRLLAVQPDARLAHILGVTFPGGESDGGYIRVADHPIAAGITDVALQFHDPAARLRLAGARAVAYRAERDGRDTGDALVTINRAGRGVAAAWAFDLARSVALTRQGDPGHANKDLDPIPGVRTQDIFVGWTDLERIGIPQADEQQRLLVNLLAALGADRIPLPRLWYFPRGKSAVMVATGDAHGIPARYIERGLQHFERYNGTASVYYATPPVSPQRRVARRVQWWAEELPLIGWVFTEQSGYPTPTNVRGWRERGHGFGLHPFVEEGVEKGYNRFWNDFVKLGYGPPDATVRTHRVLWSGWVETARVQARYGLRMNLDFYHAGLMLRPQPGQEMEGYLSGTGLPMPFVDKDGTLLSIYQQPTHLVDEHLMPLFENSYDLGLTSREAVAVSRRVIDMATQRYPSAIGLQYHFDPLSFDARQVVMSETWITGTLDYAATSGVPIMSAERWLRFTQSRHEAEMAAFEWSASRGRLRFRVAAPPNSDNMLELLVPREHGALTLSGILVDGVAAQLDERVVGGIRYAAVALAADPAGRTVEARYA